MVTHFMIVRQMKARLDKWRAEADTIERWQGEGAAEPLRCAIRDLEADLIVDLEEELDRDEAMEATGLSERSVYRRPYTGPWGDARWKVRDLIEYDVEEATESKDEEETARSASQASVDPKTDFQPTKKARINAGVREALEKVG